jgi:hypothetical protein
LGAECFIDQLIDMLSWKVLEVAENILFLISKFVKFEKIKIKYSNLKMPLKFEFLKYVRNCRNFEMKKNLIFVQFYKNALHLGTSENFCGHISLNSIIFSYSFFINSIIFIIMISKEIRSGQSSYLNVHSSTYTHMCVSAPGINCRNKY